MNESASTTASHSVSTSRPAALVAKVPAITALFWVIKVLTTGMGEAASDYLGSVSDVLAVGIGGIGFVVAMWLQFRVRRYIPAVYWFAVIMVAIFGTMAADALHVLNIPYIVTTVFYAIVLAAVFHFWYRSEGTLSIHSITTRRRETFYWATVLCTFALGTALGDLMANSADLGYLGSGIAFAVAIVVPAVGWWKLRLSGVIAFWFAYIITRPLGASFADWFGKPRGHGHGLGWGDGTVAAVALVLIVALVTYLSRSGADVQHDFVEAPAAAHAATNAAFPGEQHPNSGIAPVSGPEIA